MTGIVCPAEFQIFTNLALYRSLLVSEVRKIDPLHMVNSVLSKLIPVMVLMGKEFLFPVVECPLGCQTETNNQEPQLLPRTLDKK